MNPSPWREALGRAPYAHDVALEHVHVQPCTLYASIGRSPWALCGGGADAAAATAGLELACAKIIFLGPVLGAWCVLDRGASFQPLISTKCAAKELLGFEPLKTATHGSRTRKQTSESL